MKAFPFHGLNLPVEEREEKSLIRSSDVTECGRGCVRPVVSDLAEGCCSIGAG